MPDGIDGAIYSCNDVSGDDRPILIDANELGTVGRELSGNQGGWVIMKVAPRVVLHRVEPSAALPAGDCDQVSGRRVPDIARTDLHRGPWGRATGIQWDEPHKTILGVDQHIAVERVKFDSSDCALQHKLAVDTPVRRAGDCDGARLLSKC